MIGTAYGTINNDSDVGNEYVEIDGMKYFGIVLHEVQPSKHIADRTQSQIVKEMLENKAQEKKQGYDEDGEPKTMTAITEPSDE
uniref:Uncharacterized protein n=1 Tax=Globodera rostochiensis TaxID=31243 RepID=A0A914I4L9_GLORO